MGKGRWQHGSANRNHREPQGQQLEPENQHELSEPCAVRSRTHGSSGGKCRKAPTYPNYYDWWAQVACKQHQLVRHYAQLDCAR